MVNGSITRMFILSRELRWEGYLSVADSMCFVYSYR